MLLLHPSQPGRDALATYRNVLLMAVQAFGSLTEARQWAERPMWPSSLTPAEIARTPEGLRVVKAELQGVLAGRLRAERTVAPCQPEVTDGGACMDSNL